MIPRHLFDSLDARWLDDIFRFIDTGEASAEFLAFLEQDAECQRVVDIALALLAEGVAPYLRAQRDRLDAADLLAQGVVELEPRGREHALRAIVENLNRRPDGITQLEGIITDVCTGAVTH